MSNYLRRRTAGGTYFFTVRLLSRQSDLLVRRIDLLRDCVALTRARWPFRIREAVVLPDHLHMIWTLPEGDADFSKRWRLIKSAFSRHVDPPDHLRQSMAKRGEKGIWQRRFWEHEIRDAADYATHRHKIIMAPVVAGLCAQPQDWPHSSIQRDLRKGRLRARADAGVLPGAVGQDPPYSAGGEGRLTGMIERLV